MSTDPRDVVEQFMAAMARLDYDAAMAFVSTDVEYTNMPDPSTTMRGPDGIRAALEPFFAPTITNEWVITNVAVNGPVVMMERLDRHRLPGGWAELPVVGVFEVHDGKITRWRDYFDLATIRNGFAANLASQP